MKQRDVYAAHCPQSNLNLSSGIAPVRAMMEEGIHVGLGTDMAGGASLSLFRAMTDAIQVSKMYWRYLDENKKPLSAPEAFYLGTKGGGSFFGQVGSFEEGYEFDAVVLEYIIFSTFVCCHANKSAKGINSAANDKTCT